MKKFVQLQLTIIVLLCTTTLVVGADLGSIAEVDVSNGIDRTEALFIAETYFFNRISGCGYPAEPTSAEENWQSKTYIGIVGQPGPPIFINKMTGDIVWNDQTATLVELIKAESNQTNKGGEK